MLRALSIDHGHRRDMAQPIKPASRSTLKAPTSHRTTRFYLKPNRNNRFATKTTHRILKAMSVSNASSDAPINIPEAHSAFVDAGLAEAITRSQSFLLSEQKAEGYWVGELLVDVTLVSDMVVFYHWW